MWKLKFSILYLWPCLTYSLQTAPLNKLPTKFLEDLDKIIRSAVKDILAIPHDSPNALLYTSKKCRGLQIMRSTWEAFIQHYNICVVLLSCEDPYIPFVKDLKSEMESCIASLKLNADEVQAKFDSCPKTKPGKILRDVLRNQEYDQWCSFALRGQGVELYKECPYGNRIIIDKCGLTSSEWLNALKMSANVYPVKAIPGRSLESSLCRHCKEKETLAHVLGKCHVGSLLRTSRHHEVRSIIATHLRTLDWIVHEEVSDGASKRVDIICWRKDLKTGYILDPTIRMEQSITQAEEVNIEKQAHYNPCIPYFIEKYQLKKLEVVGLLVGARGTITGFFELFRKELRLPSRMIEEIVVATIRGSCRIAHNHLYNMNLSHS